METRILSVEKDGLEAVCAACREVFLAGGLAAFPTETVYGLGADGLHGENSAKIYAAKGRPSDNPLILHIGERAQLKPLVTEIPESAEKLMDAFWPGPLTIIFKKSAIVPETTSGGLPTIAVRMPSHPAANAILKTCGIPIAAPSANLSGRPSTTRASHVIEDLTGRVDLIIDGGDVPIGVESTIIDLTQEIPVMLRPGYITLEQLREVLGEVVEDPAIRRESIIGHTNEVLHPKAPGMKYRHYAPKAPLTIFSGSEEKVREKILSLLDENTGVLTVDEHKDAYPEEHRVSVGSLKEPESIAHNLFDALRRFDEMQVTAILSEDLTDADIGDAIMNRLLKAAGGSFVTLE